MLHRDIKPSNCFIEAGGVVKVGDFGLSVCTLNRAETNLTLTGAFLGTPAYASPEQLRGEELDVRSDIYAVGVTLFFVLTGKTPFAGDNFVQLLANVLERTPEPPVRLRREIPSGLSALVLRCLAKRKEDRFANYEQLRQALFSFCSAAVVPATLGARFMAGCLDCLVVFVVISLVGLIVTQFTPLRDIWLSNNLLVVPLYFALTEGLQGASPGKRQLHLRLTGPGGGSPGFGKVLLRCLICLTPILAIAWCSDRIGKPQGSPWRPGWGLAQIALLGAVFSTARRRNGFAGLHDLATETRVVMDPAAFALREGKERHSSTQASAATMEWAVPAPANAAAHDLGPYQALSTAYRTDRFTLLVGRDPRLLRQVWIVRWLDSQPALSPARCALARPARLRWLGGRRTSHESWDAFAGTPGQPLLQLLTRPQP